MACSDRADMIDDGGGGFHQVAAEFTVETLCFACRFCHGIWVKCVAVHEEVTTTSCKWSKLKNISSNHKENNS